MELARELKVAGLPWKPRRGDLTMDRLNDLFVVLQDGSDGAGGVVIDTGAGQEHKHFLMLTWIPRLEQALAFLARYGPCSLTARPAGDPAAPAAPGPRRRAQPARGRPLAPVTLPQAAGARGQRRGARAPDRSSRPPTPPTPPGGPCTTCWRSRAGCPGRPSRAGERAPASAGPPAGSRPSSAAR